MAMLRSCAILALLALPAGVQQGRGADAAAQSVVYETFCKLDQQGRVRLFAQLSSQARAEVARSQLERWLDANSADLTTTQISAVKGRILAIKPSDYSDRVIIIEQDMARAKAFEGPFARFTRTQLRDMSLQGPCYVKAK